MALIEFKNYPNTDTPINNDNLNFNFKEVMNLIYPVNSVVIKSDTEDYSDWLGFRWEKTLAGKVPVGIDSTDSDFNEIGKTGGEKKHTLVSAEMPSHNHGILWGSSAGDNYARAISSNVNDTVSQITYDTVKNAGGNQPHNNLQPYAVVAFWKRVA